VLTPTERRSGLVDAFLGLIEDESHAR